MRTKRTPSRRSLRGDPGGVSSSGERPHRRKARDLLGQRGGVALEHQQVDLAERPLDPGWIELLALSPNDLLRGGGLRMLIGVEQIFVELLARAGANDLD